MISRSWLPLLVLVAATGCASTFAGSPRDEVPTPAPPPRASRPSDDVEELKRRVLELQRKAAMAEVELDRLRRQVADLESRLAEDGGALGVTSSDAAEAETYVPPAAVEESDLETEPVELPEKAQSVAAFEEDVAEAAPAPAPEEGGAGAYEPISAAAQALYDRGYTLYHQGRYVDAETSFQQFLQGNPGTELTDNAQYWVGECRFARGDFQGALAAFQMTVDRFPRGNKVADAILKMGDAHQALGESERARERWEEVRRRFPGSAAAAVADDRLSG